jgi:hypothetical protein
VTIGCEKALGCLGANELAHGEAEHRRDG